MTCIACTRQEMAGDSRITGDTLHNVEKVFRHGASVFGVAGDWDACLKFIEWIPKKGTDKPALGDAAFEAMELRKDGIYLWSQTLQPYRIMGDFHAIGGGAQGAMVALTLGHSPAEAVRLVSLVCESVGGPITTLKGKR